MQIIAIDFGTQNSACAVFDNGCTTLVKSREGVNFCGKAFPSYVSLKPDGQLIAGESARRQQIANIAGTISAFKKHLGTSRTLSLQGREYRAEQLLACLIQKIKLDTESCLGICPDAAVICVPSRFGQSQRQAIADACEIAGLKPLRLINETTASALSFAFEHNNDELCLAVVDCGAGHIQTSIVELGAGVCEPLATAFSTESAGDEITYRLAHHLASRFFQKTGADILNEKAAFRRLLEACQRAKLDLSLTHTAQINIPYLNLDDTSPLHLDEEIYRQTLESMLAPTETICRLQLDQVLSESGKAKTEIDALLITGGSSRIPALFSFIENLYGQEACAGVDPYNAAVSGAAVQAGTLSGQVRNMILVESMPYSLIIEKADETRQVIAAAGMPIPCKHSLEIVRGENEVSEHSISLYEEDERANNPESRDGCDFEAVSAAAWHNRQLAKLDLQEVFTSLHAEKILLDCDVNSSGLLSMSARDADKAEQAGLAVSFCLPESLTAVEKGKQIEESKAQEAKERRSKEEKEKLNAAESAYYQSLQLLAALGEKLGGNLRFQLENSMCELHEALSNRDSGLAAEQGKGLLMKLQQLCRSANSGSIV